MRNVLLLALTLLLSVWHSLAFVELVPGRSAVRASSTFDRPKQAKTSLKMVSISEYHHLGNPVESSVICRSWVMEIEVGGIPWDDSVVELVSMTPERGFSVPCVNLAP